MVEMCPQNATHFVMMRLARAACSWLAFNANAGMREIFSEESLYGPLAQAACAADWKPQSQWNIGNPAGTYNKFIDLVLQNRKHKKRIFIEIKFSHENSRQLQCDNDLKKAYYIEPYGSDNYGQYFYILFTSVGNAFTENTVRIQPNFLNHVIKNAHKNIWETSTIHSGNEIYSPFSTWYTAYGSRKCATECVLLRPHLTIEKGREDGGCKPGCRR